MNYVLLLQFHWKPVNEKSVLYMAEGSTLCAYVHFYTAQSQGELSFQAMSQKSSDQVGSLKEEYQKEVAKIKEEMETLKASLEAKTKEVNEKNATLLQVRLMKVWSLTFDTL